MIKCPKCGTKMESCLEYYYEFELILSGLDKIDHYVEDTIYHTLHNSDCYEFNLHIYNGDTYIECIVKSYSWENAVDPVVKCIEGCELGIEVTSVRYGKETLV